MDAMSMPGNPSARYYQHITSLLHPDESWLFFFFLFNKLQEFISVTIIQLLKTWGNVIYEDLCVTCRLFYHFD